MEEIQHLSNNESFSYSWLMNTKKPIKNLDSPTESLRFSFDLETDHSRASMQCTKASQQFNFGLPCTGSAHVSHADHMIRNGSLIPLHLMNQQNNEKENNVGSKDAVLVQNRYHKPIISPVHVSLASSNDSKVLRDTKLLPSFEGSAKSSKRIKLKYYSGFLVHFYKKVKGFLLEVRGVSPRTSHEDASFSVTKLSCSSPLYDAGRENAITEAILYCKSSTSTRKIKQLRR